MNINNLGQNFNLFSGEKEKKSSNGSDGFSKSLEASFESSGSGSHNSHQSPDMTKLLSNAHLSKAHLALTSFQDILSKQ